MSYRIAIAGKGGVGKTTLAALTVRQLIARGCHPVLAVDADPNSCLDRALGVQVGASVGSIREDARQIAGRGEASGLAKQQLLQAKIAESLVEADDFDLIAMGRCEGPGCYCFANNVLKATIAELSSSYPYVVLDNEAGLENLSRRIVQQVELMVIVSDPSRNGLHTVQRLHQLAREMGIAYQRLVVVVNRLRHDELPAAAEELAAAIGADSLIPVLEDTAICECAERDASLWQLSECHPALAAINQLLDAANAG